MKILNIPPAQKKWFSIISGLLSSTVCGMLLYTFSVLVNPMQSHFEWSYSEVTFAFSLCYFISSFCCFPAGTLIEAIGVKPVILMGGVLTGAGFLLSAFVRSKYHFYLTYGIISGIGCSFLYLPPVIVIPKWWPERRVFTTGFAVVGLGLGSMIMGPLASWIILNYGWQKVFIYCGFAMMCVGVFSALLLSDVPDITPSRKEDINCPKLSIVKSSEFRLLYFAYFCSAFASLMLISQLVPVLIALGYSVLISGYFVSVFSVGNTLSRLIVGIIAENKNINNCLAVTFIMQSLALFFLHSSGSNPALLGLLIFVIGWSLGTSALLFPPITKNYFGEKTHALNYGLMLTACSFAGLIGSFLAGLLKDLTGAYLTAFSIGAGVSLVSAWVLLKLKSHTKSI